MHGPIISSVLSFHCLEHRQEFCFTFSSYGWMKVERHRIWQGGYLVERFCRESMGEARLRSSGKGRQSRAEEQSYQQKSPNLGHHRRPLLLRLSLSVGLWESSFWEIRGELWWKKMVLFIGMAHGETRKMQSETCKLNLTPLTLLMGWD